MRQYWGNSCRFLLEVFVSPLVKERKLNLPVYIWRSTYPKFCFYASDSKVFNVVKVGLKFVNCLNEAHKFNFLFSVKRFSKLSNTCSEN